MEESAAAAVVVILGAHAFRFSKRRFLFQWLRDRLRRLIILLLSVLVLKSSTAVICSSARRTGIIELLFLCVDRISGTMHFVLD